MTTLRRARIGGANRHGIQARNRRWFPKYRPAHEVYCALAREAGDGATVLHLGGGRDSIGLASALHGIAARFVCLDPNAGGLQLNPVNLKIRGDGERLPFPDGTFDLILAENVFEHLEHPGVVLSECGRCLRPGGRIIFMCPNRFGYIYLISSVTPYQLHVKFRKFALGVDDAQTFPTYYRLNSAARIRTIAGQAGLVLETIKSYVGWPTYWEFSDLLHRIFVVSHWILELMPPAFHLTLVGTLRRES